MSNLIPILQIGSTLLASIQGELRDTAASAFQQALLGRIEATEAKGVVIDISGLEMVDTFVARLLVNTGKMARIMGTDTVIVGMRPEVAATLVRMGFYLPEIKTALDFQEGLSLLSKPPG